MLFCFQLQLEQHRIPSYLPLIALLIHWSEIDNIVLLVNFILGMVEYTEMQFSLADLNQDQNLDVLDLVIIASTILDTN